MPWKAWAYLEKVSSTDFQNYLQNQTVPTFTSTAQRDSVYTTPPLGAMCITTDTYSLWVFGATGWKIAAGRAEVAQVAIPGATVLVNTELTIATLNIPAKPSGYTLEALAQFNSYATVTGETCFWRLKVNGTVVALLEQRFSGVNMRSDSSICSSQLVAIAANTAAVVTLTGQGSGATGNFTIGPPQVSWLTGHLTY